MQLKEIILKRTSNSSFNKEKVDRSLIVDLLETAVYAPNHKMREPWRFIILDDLGKENFISKYTNSLSEENKVQIIPLIHKVFQAPTVVAFISAQQPNLRDSIEDLEAVATVIQNFMLLATEQKLATSWKTPLYSETDKFKDILGLQPGELIVGLVMTGYSDVIKSPKQRKSAVSLTTFYK